MAESRSRLHAELDAILDSRKETPQSLSEVLESPAETNEPLCEADNRYVLLPIKHQDLWALYKQAQASYWVPEEIDLKSDLQDFNKMTENERTFIKNILSFFAASDFIVNENLVERFMRDVKCPEAQCFYAFQTAIESVHCVAPETEILTPKGYFEIGNLKDQLTSVWNGEKFSDVTVVQTSEASKLFKVKLSNGMELDCTDEHKWLVRVGNRKHPETCKVTRIMTKDLKEDDIIAAYDLPITDPVDPDEFRNPYTHGVFCGDGDVCNGYPHLTLYGEKKQLLPYLQMSTCREEPDQDRIRGYLTDMINKNKFTVPISYSVETKLRWLEGICDTDGCVSRSPKNKLTSIQIGSVDRSFLLDIQRLLTTLGVHSKVRFMREARQTMMPDGKGGQKLYDCKEQWVFYLPAAEVHRLVVLGFSPKRLQLKTEEVKGNARLITVTSITDTGKISPTFCFNEPERHAGIFNGILTGQSETYALLLDTLIRDPVEKHRALNAIQTIPCIEKKANWAKKWIDDRDSAFAKRLICFAIVEGIHFSGSFCAIYWLRNRNLMPGLTFSNNLIARDEGLHTEFATVLYKKLNNRLSDEEIHQIFKEAVDVEIEFICESIPCALIGMNAPKMAEYIQFVADRLLMQLGHSKLYGAKNPFGFMDMVSMRGKTSFFEGRESNYERAFVGLDQKDQEFGLDADF